jgi:ATP-dependent DNA ligase
MLRHFQPMLPTLVQKPFSSQQWLFEPKWDGLARNVFFPGRRCKVRFAQT